LTASSIQLIVTKWHVIKITYHKNSVLHFGNLTSKKGKYYSLHSSDTQLGYQLSVLKIKYIKISLSYKTSSLHTSSLHPQLTYDHLAPGAMNFKE
jgi:hypothetical protein